MKRETILAWALCAFCVIGAAVQSGVWLWGLAVPPAPLELARWLGWQVAIPVVFSVISALIIARQPRNRVGWLLMLPALIMTLPQQLLAMPQIELTPSLWLLLWFDNWSWVAMLFPVFLIPLHFPTGRPPTPRWRWVNWLAVAMWVLFMALIAFGETLGPMDWGWTIANPIGFIAEERLNGPFLIIWGLGLVTLLVSSVASLFVRYRRAGLIEREQIKWLLYAGAFFVFVYAAVFAASYDNTQGLASGWLDILLVLALLAFPVAIGIAILRYRLFDIDVIIRRTAVYGVLTGLLALVYFGSVVLLQTILGSFTNGQSPIILVISTLLIAALFAPLRRRVQGLIDRRFYRRKYDAQQVLARFAQTARDETNIEALAAELLAVVHETMQPGSISLWTRGSGSAGKQR